MQPPSPDIISIEGLPVHATIGLDNFGRSLPQPHILAIHFHLYPTSLLLAAATDDSRFSIRYWDLENQVLERVNDGAPWTSCRALARAVTGVAFMHAGDAVKEDTTWRTNPGSGRICAWARAGCITRWSGPGAKGEAAHRDGYMVPREGAALERGRLCNDCESGG